jgi:hypothetical protein
MELGSTQVRLWYEESGSLSQDISPPAKFEAWNMIIGGGVPEIANDALFTVEVLSGGHEGYTNGPLALTARKANGKVLASRNIRSILTSKKGRAVKGLWVPNIGCAGDVTFEAKLGSMRRSVKMSFPCGE